MECIPASFLKYNFLDLERQFGTLKFSSELSTFVLLKYACYIFLKDLRNTGINVTMPHPVRKKANGRPAFCIRIMPWADDVSGNRSKQYNAHMNMYVANVNLPHRKLAQEYFVCFCSTSPHASSSEQFDALSEDL